VAQIITCSLPFMAPSRQFKALRETHISDCRQGLITQWPCRFLTH